MEILENDETVLVRNVADQSHEFSRNGETDDGRCILRPKGPHPPRIVIDGLEARGFAVETEEQSTEFDLRFECGYHRGSAPRELGFDPDDDRFEGLLGLVKYGVTLTVVVADDGTTELTQVNGKSLDSGVRIG